MADVSALKVKELREQTGAGIMACKEALQASGNNFEKARVWLKQKGELVASKKSSRKASEGLVASYIHGAGRVGVLLEVNSETDFVAKNEKFQSFVKDLSLHITAMNPLYITEEDMPEDFKEREKKIFEKQALSKSGGKKIASRIAEGLYKKWLTECCLLKQVFVKDNTKNTQTVEQALNDLIAQMGENICIRRFVRFALGETEQKTHKNTTKES